MGDRESRRRFLARAVGWTGIALVAGTGSLALLRGPAVPVAGLRCLTSQEHRTFEALVDAMFPPGGAFPMGARGLDLGRVFDAFLADEDDDRRQDLRTALLLLEFGPLLFDHRLVTFSNMSPSDRLSFFESWSTSSDLVRRQIAVALRKFSCIVFYDTPDVWPSIGYALPLGGT